MALSIEIYHPKHLPKFIELNLDWIGTYFKVEKTDREQLDRPNENILSLGGEIFFVVENGAVIGTFAMLPHGEREYELIKMAVDKNSRGRGAGDFILHAAIAWAREKGADRITLLSNTVLEPAIQLYKKHGFQTTSLGPHPAYERCNIAMELKP